jgi:hypothetical protein
MSTGYSVGWNMQLYLFLRNSVLAIFLLGLLGLIIPSSTVAQTPVLTAQQQRAHRRLHNGNHPDAGDVNQNTFGKIIYVVAN